MNNDVYLVRHAQSNPSAHIPHDSWPLSSRGNIQAEKLAPLLETLDISLVYSSPYTRCIDTILPFATRNRLTISENRDLRERLIAPTLIDDFETIWNKSWADFSFHLPECESSDAAQVRIVTAITTIMKSNPETTIAISSHGNVIGLFLHHLEPSFLRLETESIRNPDVIRITRRNNAFKWDDKFVLPGLNDICTNHTETPIDKS